MNNDGIPSQEEARLPFYKNPHYYERLWFRLASALSVLLLLVLGGVKVHRDRIKKLNHTLEQQKLQIELAKKQPGQNGSLRKRKGNCLNPTVALFPMIFSISSGKRVSLKLVSATRWNEQ